MIGNIVFFVVPKRYGSPRSCVVNIYLSRMGDALRLQYTRDEIYHNHNIIKQ